MDNMPGKNIGIAQPRSNPPRPNKAVADKASFTFQRANSTMNSYFTSGSFGAPNSQNRKQRVYNKPLLIHLLYLVEDKKSMELDQPRNKMLKLKLVKWTV